MKPSITNKTITGVILAGGQSTRMGGGDKFLKEIAGKSILETVIEQFTPQCSTLIISANGDLNRLSAFKLPIKEDTIKEQVGNEQAGPLAGVLSAMLWSKENQPHHTHILSVAADSPLFPGNYSQQMINHANTLDEEAIILAKSNGWHHPIFGLWPISLANDLEIQLKAGVRKIRAWTNTHANSVVEFENQFINGEKIDPFFNINNPEDFELYEKLSRNIDL